MKRSQPSLEQIFESHIRILATTLRPGSVYRYRTSTRRFLLYLHTAFPQVRKLSQLHRDPHLLGWFRWLAEQDPPLCNTTRVFYLVLLRRLFQDLAASGHSISPDLIRREDFPPLPHYLARPLSPEDDLRLERELRQTDDLYSNALLLMRATGIRIGECVGLPLNCLRQVSQSQWALHVPLGKLRTERWVPLDDDTRHILKRLLALRSLAPTSRCPSSQGFLLPRRGTHFPCLTMLRMALTGAARRAGCTTHVHPHRLRHTYASTMLRLGVSLPALMQLLGHNDIRMTLRYLQVTQQDLQLEFHRARQTATQLHPIPALPLPPTQAPLCADLATIRDTIAATRHLLDLFRRRLDSKAARKLRRLTQRLRNISRELENLS